MDISERHGWYKPLTCEGVPQGQSVLFGAWLNTNHLPTTPQVHCTGWGGIGLRLRKVLSTGYRTEAPICHPRAFEARHLVEQGSAELN